jgi:hypothetical protein
MIDTFWCKDCERLLCEAHRLLHTCEKKMMEQERRKNISAEQIQREVLEMELSKKQFEAEEAFAKKQKADADSARYQTNKLRRKVIAGKSTHIANFIQRLCQDPERTMQAKAGLLELYPVANRINLQLWNEFESPTIQGLAQEEWDRIAGLYDQACELSGLELILDGQRFETRNSWEDRED